MSQPHNHNRKYRKTKRRAKPSRVTQRQIKRSTEEKELSDLVEKTKDPQPYVKDSNLKLFSQLPICQRTARGLSKASYVELTDIQRASLPFSLCGRDVLGAAKTGSGKTLAFLIPVLECLFRAKWSQLDGLGALIISPTRELALQIFEVLRKVGKLHSFSAGLLIGGKDLKAEQERVSRMNILVCTPGRLLQHMDQTPDFSCDNLQLLVLDEADRILDCGFEKTLNAIVANLPKTRQTLLFSATQTKSVRDLARLSLKDPEYVAVHETAEHSTPTNLVQKYMVCELPQKLDILYSFVKTHLKQKIIVFVSSCKQVRFIHETFCKMQPGIVLMCLHGKQKQAKRMAIFEQFCRKTSVCLIATDIAARGLDFPAVDWVIQLDCPEDAATYIHRVGRTARYESAGQGLLVLLPSEEKGMVAALEQTKVPIEKIKVNPSKTTSIRGQLQGFCFQSPEIKYLGQKAFISYMRSVYLQANKAIFDVHALPAEKFAESFGLPGAPKIKFVKKSNEKNAPRPSKEEDDENVGAAELEKESMGGDNLEDDGSKKTKARTKVDKMFEKKNLTVLSEHYAKLKASDEEAESGSEEEGAFFSLRRKDHDIDDLPSTQRIPSEPLTHRQLLKQKQKELASRGMPQKSVFDEDGNPIVAYKLESLEEFEAAGDIEERQQRYLNESTTNMKQADATDKKVAREKLQTKKKERKLKEKERRQEESGAGAMAVLGPEDGGDWSDNEDGEDWSDEDEDEDVGGDGEWESDGLESDGSDDAMGMSEDEDVGMEDGALDIDLSEGDDSYDAKPDQGAKSNSRKRAVEDEVSRKGEGSSKKRKTVPELTSLDKDSLEDIALRLLGE
ncbi:ATP-dependent RNA helicase dbp4 [Borealophlyctis nickersoniae]|nr:ATP-dependent RNA helicase dbp4 [Borealophlyctis nickersoniae]